MKLNAAVPCSTVLAVAALAIEASAQGRPHVETQLSTNSAEVNQAFQLTFTVMTDESAPKPSSPTLRVPRGFTKRGPRVGTKQHVSLSGSQVHTRRGISATWTLLADKPGTFTLSPSADVGGKQVNGPSRRIKIVPVGQGQPSPGGRSDPFDLLRRLPGFRFGPLLGDDDDDDEDFDFLPPYPDEFQLDKAEDSNAFLRAVVDPVDAVVGEQVTLRIYAYGARGPFREVNTSEPTRADFLSFPILDNSFGERQHRVPIESDVWHAVKVRETALFPIRSGMLEVGPFRMGFSGRGYRSASRHKGLVRHSAPVTVRVGEPPSSGRPAGYRFGDVGRFSLSAKVEPREVSTGGAVSVVVKLEGTGNLPHRLAVPAQRGLSWLEPTVVDDVGPRGSTIAGWRKFTYVVRVDRAGTIDLGEVSLPFWNPDVDSYQTATAALGTLRVTADDGASAAAAPESEKDPLDALDAARPELGAAPRAPRLWTDSRWFWLVLGLGPLGVIGASTSVGIGRRIRTRWVVTRESHHTRAREAIREARQAAAAGDGAKAASALERGVFLAIEGAVGVRARALLRDELADKLTDAGMTTELADRIVATLSDCDLLRFGEDGEQAKGSAKEVADRGAELVKSLGRFRAG